MGAIAVAGAANVAVNTGATASGLLSTAEVGAGLAVGVMAGDGTAVATGTTGAGGVLHAVAAIATRDTRQARPKPRRRSELVMAR